MEYLPTVKFGPGLEHASQIRAQWANLNDRRKTAMVMSLYPKTQTNPKLAQTVVKMLDAAIGSELTEQPNQAGVASKPTMIANAQPGTNSATTATTQTSTPATSVGQTSVGSTTSPSSSSVGATPTPPATQTPTTTSSTVAATPGTSSSAPPDANITNLAKRLGIDPKKLQSELQTMQEDYIEERRR
jgi:hypothetical protein